MKRLKKYSIFLLPIAIFFFFFIQSFYSGSSNSSFRELIPNFIKDSIYLSGQNSFSKEKAELGRYFFYDRRLSVNLAKSCASCHDPAFSFTDGYRRSIGAYGDIHQRNSAPLINIALNKYLTASDSSIHYPEQQINNPMFHDNPVELGWRGHEHEMLSRVEKDGFYLKSMKKLFPVDNNPVSIQNLQDCISSFVKSILSFNSGYDRFAFKKEENALSNSQKRGMSLFFSAQLACSKCHGGANFNSPELKDSFGNAIFYFNTGLYNLNGRGEYPSSDQGLFDLTGKAKDMGAFRVPTLRNLAFTSPYFHDGSAATLEDVVAVYENGGRSVISGPLAGNGNKNPFKHSLITGFKLNSEQRADLVNFLLSLSDSTVTINPSYTNPFNEDETKR